MKSRLVGGDDDANPCIALGHPSASSVYCLTQRINAYLVGVTELARPAFQFPIIRLATHADVVAMATVHINSWRETYPGILPEPMLARLSIATEAIRWQRMFDHPRAGSASLAFVADQQGTIVGYGSCGEQRSKLLHDHGFTAEVGELYVLRFAQRQGLGSVLMRAMAGALLERRHLAMSLWVLEQNIQAQRFYERLGGIRIASKGGPLSKVAYGWADLWSLVNGTGQKGLPDD